MTDTKWLSEDERIAALLGLHDNDAERIESSQLLAARLAAERERNAKLVRENSRIDDLEGEIGLLKFQLAAERERNRELEAEIERLYTKRHHPKTVTALERADAAETRNRELVEALEDMVNIVSYTQQQHGQILPPHVNIRLKAAMDALALARNGGKP